MGNRGPKKRMGGMTGIAVHLYPDQLERLQEHSHRLGLGISAYCRMAIARGMDADDRAPAPSLVPVESVNAD